MNSEQLTDEQYKHLSSIIPFKLILKYKFDSDAAKQLMSESCTELSKENVSEYIPVGNEFKLSVIGTNKGLGVIAAETIPRRTPILAYMGVVYHPKDFKGSVDYVLELPCGVTVDAKHKGNIFRLVNHSCVPNSFIQYMWNDGIQYAVLVSNKKIRKGMELSFDYNFAFPYGHKNFLCQCGAKRCRGLFGYILPKKLICKKPECSQEFNSAMELYTHQMETHVGLTGKTCYHKSCKRIKPFTKRTSLIHHINTRHKKNFKLKLLQCSKCKSKLRGPSHYLMHVEKCVS